MNKNIVVFGCDNSGKTTLSNSLKELLDIKLKGMADVEYKHSLGPKITLEQQKEFMETNLNKDCITIFDRFPIIEEAVCGKVLRGVNIYNTGNIEKDFEYLKNIFDKVDLFILCFPGLLQVVNWGEREQMEGVKENVMDLINEYFKIAITIKEMGYNVIEYNFNTNNSDMIKIAREITK